MVTLDIGENLNEDTKIMKHIISKLVRVIRSMRLRCGVSGVKLADEVLYVSNRGSPWGYCFPYRSIATTDMRQIHIMSNGFHKHLEKKYTEADFVIETTDTVIDCGAFVGGFSVAAHRLGARRVVSVEPSSRNLRCLKINLLMHRAERVEIIDAGLGEKCGTAKLNLSYSGCDDSLLEPDLGSMGESEEVNILSIDRLVEVLSVDPKHLFLKVEAEGYEVEIIRGLNDLRPRLIVVDITPERDGCSPRNEIEMILRSFGYNNLIVTDRCLFAKRY